MSGNTIGYSRNCSIELVRRTVLLHAGWEVQSQRLQAASHRRFASSDIATLIIIDGREVDFVVRFERGTINRFIYQYVMLAPFGEDPKPDPLVESAAGITHCQAVGFGHYQGGPDMRAGLHVRLAKVTHRILDGKSHRRTLRSDLGRETALMTKEGLVKRARSPFIRSDSGGFGGGISSTSIRKITLV